MILFRADGNGKIGLGHIMRCMSVADIAAKNGVECVFVMADDLSPNIIAQRGYACEILHTDYAEPENETGRLLPVLHRYDADIIFIDSYYITRKYLTELYEIVGEGVKIVIIDDYGDKVLPCDVLIHYGFRGAEALSAYKTNYPAAGAACPKLLLGEKYTPLREEFGTFGPKEINQRIRDILLVSGGADVTHVSYRFLQYLQDNGTEDGHMFHVVLGALCPDKEEIYRLAGRLNCVRIYENYQNMPYLMRKADFAITAGGVTLVELCACGTPVAVFFCAENQYMGKAFCDEIGAYSMYDSQGGMELIRQMLQIIKKMDPEYSLRKEMSVREQSLIDGKGAERIFREITRRTE